MTVPKHIAIIMDGNGRWAEARGQTRTSGHRAGIEPVRMCVRECVRRGIGALTLFAFSSENWRRPEAEVTTLMGLFVEALDSEVDELHREGVRLRFIGERTLHSVRLQQRIAAAESKTSMNQRLNLQVAVSYGGRWDIVQAALRLAKACASGAMAFDEITEERVSAELQLGDITDPDLFIRTGGDKRISNFLLWNLAYTELHFCEALWPDFGQAEFEAAVADYAIRERRFGRVATRPGQHESA